MQASEKAHSQFFFKFLSPPPQGFRHFKEIQEIPQFQENSLW